MSRLWPLATPVQTKFSPAALFAAARPWGGVQKRYHCGTDLQAAEGALVLAPEPTIIVAVDRGWEGTAKATLCHTLAGDTLLLGCTAPGSAPPVGTQIPAGGVLAQIGFYTKTDQSHSSMLHLQVYEGHQLTPAEANAWQSWSVGNERPPFLVDPLVWLAGAQQAKNPPPNTPPGPAVSAGGGLTLASPCMEVNGQQVCLVNHVQAWFDALVGYQELMLPAEQAALALIYDAKTHDWTPTLQAAEDKAVAVGDVLEAANDGTLPGLPGDQVKALMVACQRAVEAREVFAAFAASKPNKGQAGTLAKKKKKSSGSGIIVAGGLGLVLAGGAAVVARRRT